MSAFPELTKLPDAVFCGQVGDCYACGETDEGVGLLLFMDEASHARSTMPEDMKGNSPVQLTREEVMDLCDVAYIVDPDTNEYVSFIIRNFVPTEEL